LSQCSEIINYYVVLNYAVQLCFLVWLLSNSKMSLFLIIKKWHYFKWRS